MRKYKVCVVTATRAEYGLLSPLMEEIQNSEELTLQVLVTGTHLSSLYGYTINQIVQDGFKVDEAIEVLETSDDELGILKTMSNAQWRIGEALLRLQSDLVVVLGDRYELLPIVSSCVVLNIPVCHIHGGEITQGANDELFRHAISKMSMLHFPATHEYAKRLIQMGEQPQMVYNVGSLGVESIKKKTLLSAEALAKQIDFVVDKQTLLVTFHPITLEASSQNEQMRALLDALACTSFKVLFTRPNADLHRSDLNTMIDEFVESYPNRAKAYSSLGQLRYLSAMKYCLAVVGNSSSGIIETPSFHIPTINIGNRQEGRLAASSVMHVEPLKEEILKALNKLNDNTYLKNVSATENPYEGGDTAATMCRIIIDKLKQGMPSTKIFHDLKEVE